MFSDSIIRQFWTADAYNDGMIAVESVRAAVSEREVAVLLSAPALVEMEIVVVSVTIANPNMSAIVSTSTIHKGCAFVKFTFQVIEPCC